MKNLSIILILLLSITFVGCDSKKNNSNIHNNSNAVENKSDSSTDNNVNENTQKDFTVDVATKILDDIYKGTENINYGCTEDLYKENDKTFYLFRITTLKDTSSKVAGSVGYIKVYNDHSVSNVYTSYYDAINTIN
ncbi:hypothetical protein KQI30_12955 [Clostridium bornimense]|uniref:hypothetical protein n=2 Tax=Clostridium TaxID=1485 RepID=UPI001C11FD39|nr:hypothetical protein [Clostridium bornimense]MBU5317161.1 hypothetical protein [Clostridium bornimense]